MNWIWFGLIVGSVVTAAFTGKMAEVTAASIDSAKSAVTLAIGLVGVMAFWLGMLRIVQVGGFLHTLARWLHPLMVRLFPDVPADHETTINLICNGTLAFTQHPDQWAILKSDPDGKTVRATEECLRYDSPVRSIQRIAMDDIELNGQQINKNDRVRWFIPGANRDPKVFDRADDFDIERYPNQHVAFGSGIHHCLGATLARLEGQEIFRNLANRFDKVELEIPVEDVQYDRVLTFRAVESLPVAVTNAK